MYLVTGATGHVGGAVAQQLHEQSHSVRALVRDPSRAATLPAGIELAAGDLDDPASVAKAGSRIASQDGDDRRRVIIKFATRCERTSLPAVDSLVGCR